MAKKWKPTKCPDCGGKLLPRGKVGHYQGYQCINGDCDMLGWNFPIIYYEARLGYSPEKTKAIAQQFRDSLQVEQMKRENIVLVSNKLIESIESILAGTAYTTKDLTSLLDRMKKTIEANK